MAPVIKSVREFQFGMVALFAALHLAALGVFLVPFRWHTNHHRFMYACRQGEVDFTYDVFRFLNLVWHRARPCAALGCL
jgi:hypothetical protein